MLLCIIVYFYFSWLEKVVEYESGEQYKGIAISHHAFEENVVFLPNEYKSCRVEDREVTLKLNPEELIALGQFHYKILDDTGFTVLAKVSSEAQM